MLSTDWVAITTLITRDLLVRWSCDASNISNGIGALPESYIYLFKIYYGFGIVIYHDATFAILCIIRPNAVSVFLCQGQTHEPHGL